MNRSVLLNGIINRAAALGGAEQAGYCVAALAEMMCGRREPFPNGIEYRQTIEYFRSLGTVTGSYVDSYLAMLKASSQTARERISFRCAVRRALEGAEKAKNAYLYADMFFWALLENPSPATRAFLSGEIPKVTAPRAQSTVQKTTVTATPKPESTVRTTTTASTVSSSRSGVLDDAMKEKIRSYQKAARSTPCVRELADHFSLPDEILRTKITDREALRRLRRGRFGFATVRYPNGTTCEHRIYCGDGLVILDEREHDPIVFDSFVDDSYFAECLGFQSVDLRRREGRDIFSEVFVSFKLNVYFESALKWGEVLAVAGYPVSLYYDEHDRFWYVD